MPLSNFETCFYLCFFLIIAWTWFVPVLLVSLENKPKTFYNNLYLN